jgi:hypothetical protein
MVTGVSVTLHGLSSTLRGNEFLKISSVGVVLLVVPDILVDNKVPILNLEDSPAKSSNMLRGLRSYVQQKKRHLHVK